MNQDISGGIHVVISFSKIDTSV